MDIKQDRSPLELRFRGRIIEHLGLQLYSQPVNAIAEIIANAWDAEAERVDVVLPEKIENICIDIKYSVIILNPPHSIFN